MNKKIQILTDVKNILLNCAIDKNNVEKLKKEKLNESYLSNYIGYIWQNKYNPENKNKTIVFDEFFDGAVPLIFFLIINFLMVLSLGLSFYTLIQLQKFPSSFVFSGLLLISFNFIFYFGWRKYKKNIKKRFNETNLSLIINNFDEKYDEYEKKQLIKVKSLTKEELSLIFNKLTMVCSDKDIIKSFNKTTNYKIPKDLTELKEMKNFYDERDISNPYNLYLTINDLLLKEIKNSREYIIKTETEKNRTIIEKLKNI